MERALNWKRSLVVVLLVACLPDPIVVTPAKTSKVTETDNSAANSAVTHNLVAVAALLAMQAAGAEPYGPIPVEDMNQPAKTYTRTQVIPAETRHGVRFHFRLDTIEMWAKDPQGKMIPGVHFVPMDLKRRIEVRDVVASAQPAAKVLQRGDVILSLDGVKVNDAGLFIKALKTKKPGDQVNITYCPANSRSVKILIAEAGRPLGVALMSAYRESDLPGMEPIADRPNWMKESDYVQYWGECFRAQKNGDKMLTPEQWRDNASR